MKVTTQRIAQRVGTSSHQRALDAADDDAALVETTDLDRHYRVMLPDSSQGVHETMLAIDRWGHLQADCDCAHMSYGDGLCAHILTLLLHRERGIETIDGQAIIPGDRHDEGPAGVDAADAGIDADIEHLPPAADAGSEVTNADAEVDPDAVTVDEDAVDTGDGITVDGGIETDDNWSDRL